LNLLRNENEIFVPHGPQNHENSTKTANFEGFLTHFGHYGAFLLEFWPFFRFFDPLFRKSPSLIALHRDIAFPRPQQPGSAGTPHPTISQMGQAVPFPYSFHPCHP
jgi:hypothetical protein